MARNKLETQQTGQPEFGKKHIARGFSNTLVPIGDPTWFDSGFRSTELQIQHEIEDERRRFWNALVSIIPSSGYIRPKGRRIEILDVACGKCTEGKVLNAFFGGNSYNQLSTNVVVTGIDIRDGMIAEAIEENLDLPSNFKFICGDATKLSMFPDIPMTADVIVIRHQEIINGELVWIQIFQEAISRLQNKGIGIISSYTNTEHDMILPLMEELGCTVLMSFNNEFARPTRIEGVSIDKNIILFRKTSIQS